MLHKRVKFFSKVCIAEPYFDVVTINLYFALLRNELKSHHVSKSLIGTCARMGSVGPRVLSIQSHVVSGYVGNKSATFPLQVLGFEVDTINSVQFSNHTGYGSWTGQILQDTDLAQLIEGLQKNKLDHYTHLLTGYVGSAKFLTQTAKVLKHLRERNPNLVFVCDPVMGDNGTLYVPEDFLPIYRDLLIPLADIVTPNQFEVELLTGQKIQTLNDAWKAVNVFHSWGTRTVVLSSTDLGDSEHLLGLASSIKDGKRESLSIKIPRLPASFTGSGDLFAALFMAWMYHTKENTKLSLENTIASLHKVLQKTLEYASSSPGDFSEDLPRKMASMELRLVQSRKDIEFPDVCVRASVHEDIDAICK